MSQEWHSLTALTDGSKLEVERVRVIDSHIRIEGQFELPPLARLTMDDQVFVAAFVRCHGSIKQMEKSFGVSYPTIKNRLNHIGEMLPFAEIEMQEESPKSAGDLLELLERGEITVKDALAELENRK